MSGRWKSLRTTQVLRATTTSPWTIDFRHLSPIPKSWFPRQSTFFEKKLKAVPPKDRIKWWNIVPGDEIRIRGSDDDTLHEVLSINRFSNRVFLRAPVDENAPKDREPRARSVHYSKCQLFIHKYTFPPTEPGEEPKEVNVFASRIGNERPKWSKRLHRWVWDRYAVKTVPQIPGVAQGHKAHIRWPTPARKDPPPRTPYDTTEEWAKQRTYQPTPLPKSPRAELSPLSKNLSRPYVNWLLNPKVRLIDPGTSPLEACVVNDLSPPHARAKKQRRWQEKKKYQKALLQRYIQRMRKIYPNKKEAKQWALFRWKQRLLKEHQVEMERRSKIRGEDVRAAKNEAWKGKKKEKKERKLREVVLEEASNQVIPEPLKSSRT